MIFLPPHARHQNILHIRTGTFLSMLQLRTYGISRSMAEEFGVQGGRKRTAESFDLSKLRAQKFRHLIFF